MHRQNQDVIYKLKKITAISMVFMFVQLLGGYYAHSIAIIADAFHLFSDVLAYVISLYAVYKSTQISPPHLTFGYDKMQPLGALLNVAIIWIVTVELFIEATKRMINNSIVEEPTYMLLTSIFGLGCNLYIMRVLHSDEHSGHHNCGHSHHNNNNSKDSSTIQQAHKHSTCNHNHGNGHQHNHSESHQHHEGHSHDHHNCKGHNHDHNHQQQDNIPNLETSFRACLDHNKVLQEIILEDKSKSNCCEHQVHSNNCNPKGSSPLKNKVLIPNDASDEEQIREQRHVFQNINIEAAYIHILTDIILSIGVILSASIIYFCAPEGWSYWQLADPLCTYLFSFMAIYSTISISKESIILLLDGCEHPEFIIQIKNQLKEDIVVKQVKDLRVWSTNRGKHFGVLKLKIGEGDLRGVRRIFSSRGITGFIQLQEEQVVLAVQQ